MDPGRMMELQMQMRQNNDELQTYLSGLDSWVDDMKEKEMQAPTNTDDKPKLPPVRNSLAKKKKKKKVKVKDVEEQDKEKEQKAKPRRIRGFDFRGWDKYDVDKALEEIDGEEKQNSSSSEYETDEEGENERRMQQANDYKEQGNIAFKEGSLDKAIEFYTFGMELDPTNAILPANRAMALIKQEKFAAAEVDCTTSIALDPTYVKAYSRRATSRVGLKRYEEANRDFDKVLSLEPKNKFAIAEKRKLAEKLQKPSYAEKSNEINENMGMVHAIYKAPAKRSKKPLRRIQIEEIGADDGQSIRDAIAKTEAAQSDTKRKVTEKDSHMFEQFMSDVPGSIAAPAPKKEERSDDDLKLNLDNENNEPTEPSASQTFTNPAQIGMNTDTPAKNKGMTPVAMETTSPRTSPRLPDVPTTSFQFQADWKMLKKQPDKLYQYFKRIDPSEYTKLIGQAFDADILTGVISILHDFYLPAEEDCYAVLQHLANVKRFSMTIMFKSPKDKKCLQTLFEKMRSLGHDSADIDKLAKKYEL